MFTRWGHTVFRHRWRTIVLAALFAVLAGAWGAGVLGSLSAGGFADRDSEAARATRMLESTGRSAPDVVVVYEHDDLTVDDAAYRRAVTGSLAGLPDEHVRATATYWSTGDERLVSPDRHLTYATVVLAGGDDTERAADYAEIRDELEVAGFEVIRGGPEAVFSDVSEQVGEDVKHAEMLSMPLVLVLCILIYGSVVAASLPLLVGGIAVLGAFAAVRSLTAVTDVSVFSLNIITLLGLGLAIDYALFVVTRFREQLARGDDVEAAVVATVATAGRTIVWSGLTVALSLASLLMFPQVFLRSMGIGGVAAVVVAMTAALTVLPAVLSVLGHRVDSWRLFSRRSRGRRAAVRTPGKRWASFAHLVMRRPLVFLATGFVVLVALGAPFLGATFGGVDERALPASTESRVASETIAEELPGAGSSVAEIVTTGLDELQLRGFAAAAEDVPGVAAVTTEVNDEGPSVIQVAYGAEAQSGEARAIVTELRELPVPDGGTALVRGETAELVDLLGSLSSILPWMALTVAVTTFVLLFLAFGSVVVPLKAIAMAAISLCASFGVVVWVFQDGHGSGLLGFTETGYVDATQPILMLAVLFGLSMDYELFLLSRVREEWDRTHDNTHAVAVGLQRTGRIITSAALLLIVVVAGFSTSGITFIKMMGVGMIVALVVDATLVRAVLVPATMRLLGSANWYAPPRLARWWAVSGLREHDPVSPAPVPPEPGSPARELQPAGHG
ncbi:MAG TPA: MMPL family transporter [Marmoricola sp.]|nr:MMPL family transporter [Marmoricola sp.]